MTPRIEESERRAPRCLGMMGAMAGLMLAPCAQASQWWVVNLHVGQGDSRATAVGSGQQVGQASAQASLWTGSPDSWVSLHPAGAHMSIAWGADAGQQVGFTYDGTYDHAALWRGSAESRVDLNPAGATYSLAFGVRGGTQVGRAKFGQHEHAGLWTGSAQSWVDLHSIAWHNSWATDLYGDQVVGCVDLPAAGQHACLWTGARHSWVDLNPTGSQQSSAGDVYDGQQVGWVYPGGGYWERASLWTGTSESWKSLHPAGWKWSEAYGVYAGQQVGVVGTADDYCYASIWSGSATSWVNLHPFLPANFTKSRANDIWGEIRDGVSYTYVVGEALNSTTGHWEAVMWVIPEPTGALTMLAALIVLSRTLRGR